LPAENKKTIYTIGHSTRPLEEFIKLLRSFNIQLVADVRSYPGSKRFPQYNKENLLDSLSLYGILYQHFPGLGGRRKALKESKNIAWKNEAFRGYADYMETDDFKEGIVQLEGIALKKLTAYMCSEAVWWRCHRSLVSDYLKHKGWVVLHIMAEINLKNILIPHRQKL
jgi:uncharacterized protein (DUF488 family)